MVKNFKWLQIYKTSTKMSFYKGVIIYSVYDTDNSFTFCDIYFCHGSIVACGFFIL